MDVIDYYKYQEKKKNIAKNSKFIFYTKIQQKALKGLEHIKITKNNYLEIRTIIKDRLDMMMQELLFNPFIPPASAIKCKVDIKMINLLKRIENVEQEYVAKNPNATETDSMVHVLETFINDDPSSILTCYQFIDRVKEAQKEIRDAGEEISDEYEKEQLKNKELQIQIENILSEYGPFGFDYDTIFDHVYNY